MVVSEDVDGREEAKFVWAVRQNARAANFALARLSVWNFLSSNFDRKLHTNPSRLPTTHYTQRTTT